MGTVYIVHCVDTEGPLYESPMVPFEQIKRVFGIEIDSTVENLEKLRKGEIDLEGKEDAVKTLLDQKRMETNGDWNVVEKMLSRVTSKEFRMKLPDSNGNGWIYNWFCLDHVGFTGNNPRRRDEGHHKVYDRYLKMVNEQKMGDIVQFHHHPVSHSGNFNDCGTAFWGRNTLDQIFCHKIIDRGWFPTVYRPGFHTERPDSNWFLEQWMPFDYGNQSMRKEEVEQTDLSNGRFGDWRHAPIEWIPYHPSHDDYQKRGNCRRWITRCLNMYARIRQITAEEIENAFETAKRGENVILSFTNHDFRDMGFEVDHVREMIADVATRNPEVKFLYADAITAMRNCLGLKKEKMNLQVNIERKDEQERLLVTTEGKIFGPQPYLAIKLKNGTYLWDNYDFVKENVWSYTFDANTMSLEEVETIGIASNNAYGMTEVILITPDGASTKCVYNE